MIEEQTIDRVNKYKYLGQVITTQKTDERNSRCGWNACMWLIY